MTTETVLECELAVGGLDLLVGGIPGHAEHLVGVPTHCGGRRPLHLPRRRHPGTKP